jgi:hypothetical protein
MFFIWNLETLVIFQSGWRHVRTLFYEGKVWYVGFLEKILGNNKKTRNVASNHRATWGRIYTYYNDRNLQPFINLTHTVKKSQYTDIRIDNPTNVICNIVSSYKQQFLTRIERIKYNSIFRNLWTDVYCE